MGRIRSAWGLGLGLYSGRLQRMFIRALNRPAALWDPLEWLPSERKDSFADANFRAPEGHESAPVPRQPRKSTKATSVRQVCCVLYVAGRRDPKMEQADRSNSRHALDHLSGFLHLEESPSD